MQWIIAAFAIVLIACAAILASGRWGSMPPVVDDRYPGRVPDGEITSDVLRDVRFELVPRGYSPTQVDALLARVADQLGADRLGADQLRSDPRGIYQPEIGSPETGPLDADSLATGQAVSQPVSESDEYSRWARHDTSTEASDTLHEAGTITAPADPD